MSDEITVFRRMELACKGHREERDILRTAIEEIAAGTPAPWVRAKQALDADRERREQNLASLSEPDTGLSLLQQIVAIMREPLNERPGDGPTRESQFLRIDALLVEAGLA